MNALSDKLLDFSREQNLALVADFDALRGDLLQGRPELARERFATWSAALARHMAWEEAQVFPTYAHHCRPGDRATVDELARDHQLLSELTRELSGLVDRGIDPWCSVVSELLSRINAVLIEHRVRTEAEICAPLDHVLDAPTIERIETAFDNAPETAPDTHE